MELLEADIQYYFDQPSNAGYLLKEKMKIKDCRSVLLTERLAKLGYLLYKEGYGYQVVNVGDDFLIHVSNLNYLEAFIKALEGKNAV
jgi:hypothetical protein